MKFVSSLVVLGSLASCVAAADCNADNCLRGLRATARIDEARGFCGTFTTAIVTATEGLPTYAAAACTGDVASRISSACSCIAVSTTTPVCTYSEFHILCYRGRIADSNTLRWQLLHLPLVIQMQATQYFHYLQVPSTSWVMRRRIPPDQLTVELVDQQPPSMLQAQAPMLP